MLFVLRHLFLPLFLHLHFSSHNEFVLSSPLFFLILQNHLHMLCVLQHLWWPLLLLLVVWLHHRHHLRWLLLLWHLFGFWLQLGICAFTGTTFCGYRFFGFITGTTFIGYSFFGFTITGTTIIGYSFFFCFNIF